MSGSGGPVGVVFVHALAPHVPSDQLALMDLCSDPNLALSGHQRKTQFPGGSAEKKPRTIWLNHLIFCPKSLRFFAVADMVSPFLFRILGQDP